MTDEELLAALCDDPDRGLGLIMKRYTGLIYTVVYGHISSNGTPSDAKELVSDVFVDLWLDRESTDPRRKIAPCSLFTRPTK